MADLGPDPGPDLEEEGLEDDLLPWFTVWQREDREVEAELQSSFLRLRIIRREKAVIFQRLLTGGRKSKHPQRTNEEHNQRIMDDYFGMPEVKVNGVVVKEMVPPWQTLAHFTKRYRMGDVLFSRLLEEIQHEVTRHKMFRVILDALGEKGPSALQRLTAVLRILAYGISFDAVHEYTGVKEETARKSTYAFCEWLAAYYEHIFLGVWTPEAIAKEMAINKKRGFSGMLGSIDCTHWI